MLELGSASAHIYCVSDAPPKNTNPLADYARFAAWVLPSFVIWLFGEFVIMPKVEVVLSESSPLVTLQRINNILYFNFWFIVIFLVALAAVLEGFWKPWKRRWRAITLGIFAWIFHVYVLVTMVMVSALSLVSAELTARGG